MHYQPADDLLHQRTLLVTGAGDGIGREAALTYARYGAHVLLTGRDSIKLQRVKKEIDACSDFPADVLPLDLNNATPQRCQQFAAEVAGRVSHLDGLLHNAGILGEMAPLATYNPTLWQQVMHINVNSLFYLTQALLPLLLQSDSASMILTSSGVGRCGRAGWGAYAVSKFATEGLMQVLADEYKGQSLRVNCINPGATRTRMRANAYPNEDANRLRTPAEIMPLYLYLMGNDSLHENGRSFDAQPLSKPGPA